MRNGSGTTSLYCWTRFLAVASLAFGCSDTQGPSQTPSDAGPFIVSSPVQPRDALGDGAASPLLDPAVVYVSLPPGALRYGFTVGIVNHRTGDDTTAMVIDGGFDPVPLPAREGDTVVMIVGEPAAGTPTTFASVVTAAARPIVVRTSPPRHKRDVSLNAIVVIVFSEPLDPATVDTGSIRLWRGAVAAPGTVRFADTAHLRVQFDPDSLLAPETDYQLVATSVIRNLNGLTLDSTVNIPFTTGTAGPATGLVFSSVSAKSPHTCGITTGGDGYCWGIGFPGSGDPSGIHASPIPVAGGVKFVALAAGHFHACGLTVDGTVYCWGDNRYGALGDGTVTDRATPVPVAGGLTFAGVSGAFHTCGVTPSGTAYCWGPNNYGQLGDGTTTDRWVPVAVAGGLRFRTVSAGMTHTCGVTVEGAAYCWGYSGDTVPMPVAGGLSFASVSAGGEASCGLTDAGAAYCWGQASLGQLGISPSPVAGGLGFAMISTGGGHTCGVTSAGEVYCWGSNIRGQLGRGTQTEELESLPGLVTGGLSFATVDASGFFTCGITRAGTAYCWGANDSYQLGNDSLLVSTVPVGVGGQR